MSKRAWAILLALVVFILIFLNITPGQFGYADTDGCSCGLTYTTAQSLPQCERSREQQCDSRIDRVLLFLNYFDFNKSEAVRRVQNSIFSEKNSLTISSPSPRTIASTSKPSHNTGITSGVSIKDIKYTLPQGWEAKVTNETLFISPQEGGGYLSIRTDTSYSPNIGRREYYCQVSNVCIEETTYFTEMKIGNIDGYIANALDNSGGGSEYFGSKGSAFYIISSYSPPSPNEFEKNFRRVLESLVF